MSKTRQLALPLETHRNHYLFSDHFLNQVLPDQAIWRESEAEAKQALDAIVELYSQLEDALPHYSEAALEQEWIRPTLSVLGHVYHVQPPLTGALGTPDYAFFSDEPAKQAAAPAWGTPAFWETVLAVGDAKRWDRPLDKRLLDGAPDAFTNANPCYQIDYYLRRTGCAWGVVSNGRRWRIYHQDTSFRLDVFYEVDLVQLIEQGDVAAFRYFYLFFRAAAFRPDAEGHCWLDEVLAESTAYAVQVGDELKERVYKALRLLAQGFLDYPVDDPEQALDPATDLTDIHDACLILLYRLLFLLYAESRGLLPVDDNPSYAGQYSLKALKEDIAHKLDEGVVYLAKKATIWDDLRTLFDIIYSGQETLGVPAYDGRLFDPHRYPFLEERTIGDRYLAQAIDLLARAEAGRGQGRSLGLGLGLGLSFVDYRDLQIRHLGSIYEGLLEYRMAYAAEEMVVVRRGRKKTEEIIPAAEAGKDKVVERIPAGQVYLVTDRGERKATGSYYTPDYIVKYIVEQTLGPLADAQAEAVEQEIAALKEKNKGRARRTKAYKDELARLQNSFADRILALNALDPAMGSGHFLVEATDYLARRIVEAGVVTEPLADGDEESELSYWRRRVVERCIYGVDLNPLAVELAKLSLWLTTVAKGKPLSFLDHHLRCGNSLIGARVADLQALPVRKGTRKARKGRKGRKARKARKTSEVSETSEVSQLAMWDESAFTQDMYRVVGAMRQIQEYETADLISVKEKERLFEETVEQERRKWRAIADLWTASYFGLELTPELYNACVQYVQGKPVLLQAAQAEAVLERAHEIWKEKRFFHWEIEFPEVFFDEYGRHKGDAAGFDAVVGNPPWGASLSRPEHNYLRLSFDSTQATLDSFATFTEQGIAILRMQGRLGYIVPSGWQTGKSYVPFRELVLRKSALSRIVNLPYDVFPDAYVDSTIAVVERKNALDDAPEIISGTVKILTFNRREYLSQINDDDSRSYRVDYASWFSGDLDPNGELAFLSFLGKEDLKVAQKTVACSMPLGEIADVQRGITPFHLEEQRLEETYKLALDGELRRYYYEISGNRFVRYDESIAEYKPPRYFRGPRIILRELISRQFRLQAVMVNEDFVTNKSHQSLLVKDGSYSLGYLLAIVNSRILSHYHIRGSAIALRDDFPKIVLAETRNLPIRRIAFTTPPEERERLVEEGLDHEAREMERNTRNAKGGFVPFADSRAFRDSEFGRWVQARLSAEPEQSDVVHDILAHLAERMIEMHKAKQVEVRSFLDWLAGYTGRPIDDWALKTNLRNYYEHDWTEMERILKRNQRKLPNVALDVDTYKNEPAARIRTAWETSMETLRPLLARIEATDRLIDQIVYQLYGLTEEEIAVVEGRSQV
ncbi:MAG: Eco57I restriction-modification methylase domain-containing protein [Anaerolineae bacterium]